MRLPTHGAELMTSQWQSLPHLFYAQADRWESRPLVYGKPNLHWRPLTWRQVADRSRSIAAALIERRVALGDRVAIWMKSSPEWMLCDLGSLSAGCTNVPIHEGASDEELVYLLRDSQAVGVFVQDRAHAVRVRSLSSLLPALQWVVTVHKNNISESNALTESKRDRLEAISSSYLLRDFQEISEEAFRFDPNTEHDEDKIEIIELSVLEESSDPKLVEARLSLLSNEQTLTLQYTSGTTGEPKGVILSHENILSNCAAAIEAVPITPDDTLLSFLPLSHSFERVAGYYMPTLFGGAKLYFAEGLGKLIRNLNEVSPTVMTGVPRIYEKIYARFRGKRGAQGKLRRTLSQLALALSPKMDQQQTPGRIKQRLNHGRRWINQQLFSEFRERLGGRLRLMVSGGAPLDEQVAQFFEAAGLIILEGYGLSETSPVLTVNRPHAYRFGSVGKKVSGVQLKIAHDGEILAKGPNITVGYHNKPEESAALFDRDGWLLTGDIGRFDEEGYLFITGRKKDIFKTASGKMIAPQYIERLFNSSPLIEQTYVIGEQRPYCVALIVLSEAELIAWSEDIGYPLPEGGRSVWSRDVRVKDLFDREVSRLNRRLSRHETIKRHHLCHESFVSDELMTPSLKLKRSAAQLLYAEEISLLYGAQTP